MRRLLYPCLLIFLIGPVRAATSQQDYAYQALLSETDQPLQRIELPLDVMLALTNANLSDLAVFNVHGKQQPHAVMRTPAAVSEHTLVLPFHEFSSFQRQNSKTVTRREQSQQAGSISELRTTETIAVESVRKDYLIELAPDADTPEFERIELQWVHEPAGQLLELKVEVGNELDNLRVIKQRKNLTNQSSDDNAWRSIDDIPRNHKYMRLSPVNAVTRFELQQVHGHYRKTGQVPGLTHQIEPSLSQQEQGEFYFFEFPSAVRAETMRIIPSTPHSVIKGDLYAGNAEFDTRQRIYSGFSQHNIDDDEVKPSKPIRLTRRNLDKAWFSINPGATSPPLVELNYPQYEVIFLGDDNGPYTLAWGNYENKVAVTDLAGLVEGNLQQAQRRSALVSLVKIQVSGGTARLTAPTELPWQKWLLWSLLLAAALVTGKMSFSLYREMNDPQKT
jgi:hypothetical protein